MAFLVILSCIISNLFGVALHFTHTKKSSGILVHMLSAVNESVWEHLKLAFIPMFFFSFLHKFLLDGEFFNIFEANLSGILFSLIFIPTIYYLSTFILKKENVIFDILLFVISMIISYFIIYIMLQSGFSLIGEVGSVLAVGILFSLFAIFTFYPPKHFLFKDPLTKKFDD